MREGKVARSGRGIEIVRYWCFVTSKENWQVCKKHNVWGVDFRYFVTLKKFIKKGDKAVVYTHGGTFVAAVEVTSNAREEFNHTGWTKKGKPYMFPYRVDIRIIKEGEIPVSFSTVEDEKNVEKADWEKPNFIDEVVFIADKGRTWNQYLQVSMVNITKENFEKIELNL